MSLIGNELRRYLVGLAKRRKNGKVSADDAHAYLDRAHVTEEVRKEVIHEVFNNNNLEFNPNGTIPSKRPVAKGRKITVWELAVTS